MKIQIVGTNYQGTYLVGSRFSRSLTFFSLFNLPFEMPDKQHYTSWIIYNLQNLKVFESDILLGIRSTIPQNQFNSDCQIKLGYRKCIRFYEKVHLRSDLWKRKIHAHNLNFQGDKIKSRLVS